MGYAFNRTNHMGQKYHLIEVLDGRGDVTGKTEIRTNGKKIVVNHPIMCMSQAWYDWMMRGYPIQTAFHFLSADEREFLLTGITPEEWNKLFSVEAMENEL